MNLPDRQYDERVLRVLALRSQGADLETCATEIGSNVSSVSKMISKARLADIQECAFWGDKPATVAAAWRPTIAQMRRATPTKRKPE